jgi:DNA-binding winged helix-turn-helix (wHTH) protein
MRTTDVFHFGEFRLETGERRLTQGRHVIHLSPKAHDVLVLLVRQAGRLVTKDDLLSRVWPDTSVEEGILTVHVAALRKALGDDKRSSGYIETVSRSGYRFVAPVTLERVDHVSGPLHAHPRPVELYELVGRGRARILSGSYFELSEAVATFRAAIEIDATYAAAHAGLSLARCLEGCLRAVPYQEAFAEAKASALRALAMDSECADAQMSLGTVLFVSEWDWAAAERSLRRALELSPSHTEALLAYGGLLEALGRLDEGLRFKQQALARNPESCWCQPKSRIPAGISAGTVTQSAGRSGCSTSIRVTCLQASSSPGCTGSRETWSSFWLRTSVAQSCLAFRRLQKRGSCVSPLTCGKHTTRESMPGSPDACSSTFHRTVAVRSRCSARCSTVQPVSSMRHSNTWTGRSISAIRRSCTSPSRRSGTACATTHGSAIG